ncbi:MAG: ATP-binding protein [Mariprofundaceae bacterium]
MLSTWWLLPLFVLLILVFWQRGKLHRLEREQWRTASELQDSNEQLRQRSDRLDAVFSTVNEAIIRLDKDANVLAMNGQARRLFRLPRSLQMPQPMAVFYRRTKWNKAIRKALAQMPEPCEIPDIHIGDYILAVRLAPLDENGALLLCLDISRQRELEAQRDQLIRDLMHDLKTPLTSIFGYARSIESFGDNKALCKEAANTIVQESKRLNQLIESMLTLHQLAGGMTPGDVVCDAVAVTHELQQLLMPVAKKKGVCLDVVVDDDCDMFPMDGSDLYRLLTNVVENAIRHTPDGGCVSLHMHCTQGEAGLRVVDDGPGIDPKHLSHVTERFYRTENDRGRHISGQSGGHGMGLAIVQETVNRYGGRLVLSNRPEGGLEVYAQFSMQSKVQIVQPG